MANLPERTKLTKFASCFKIAVLMHTKFPNIAFLRFLEIRARDPVPAPRREQRR